MIGAAGNQSVISRLERRESQLKSDTLAGLARALMVSTDYLLGLTDEPRPGMAAIQPEPGQGIALVITMTESHGEITERGICRMREQPLERPLRIPAEWFEDQGSDPGDCLLIQVHDDATAPVLPEQCRLVVDTARREKVHNSIVILKESKTGRISVRQLHRLDEDNRWIWEAHNRVATRYGELSEDVEVVGRVIMHLNTSP